MSTAGVRIPPPDRRAGIRSLPRPAEVVLVVRRTLGSTVGKNALSLYSIQFAQYILPLIALPYLARVLGPWRLGTLAFGQSLMSYIALGVDYGFGLSATRKISTERESPAAVNRIANTVWAAKALLASLGLLILLLLIRLVPRFHALSSLLLLLFVGVSGGLLFPAWLFQGLEQMLPASIINLSVRTLSVLAMFVLVRGPQDYLVYAALVSFGSLLGGAAGAWIAVRRFRLTFSLPSWADIWRCLKEGCVSFFTLGAISFYSSANGLILGFLASDLMVGFYSAAERVTRMATSVWGPLSQAVYPRFSKLAVDSKQDALHWGRRMLLVVGAVGLLISVTLFLAAPLIIKVAFGPRYESSVTTLRLLSPLPFMIAISNVLGMQVLFPFRRERVVLASVALGGAVNLALSFLLAPVWKANGMAFSVMTAEFAVTAVQFGYLWKAHLNPLQAGEDSSAKVRAQEGMLAVEAVVARTPAEV
ncbi:MAG: flippase [Terriglobia bacterium]